MKRLLSLVDADADCCPERYPFRGVGDLRGVLYLLLRQRERLVRLRERAWAFRELAGRSASWLVSSFGTPGSHDENSTGHRPTPGTHVLQEYSENLENGPLTTGAAFSL